MKKFVQGTPASIVMVRNEPSSKGEGTCSDPFFLQDEKGNVLILPAAFGPGDFINLNLNFIQ